MDFHQFYMGNEFDAHQYFGPHPLETGGFVFRTFAPNASKISLIGDFANGQELEMNRLNDRAFFELEVPEAKAGDKYQFRIYNYQGAYTDHADPYARYSELRPDRKSIIPSYEPYPFSDEAWMEKRKENGQKFLNEPMNIYEVHAGSWKQHEDGSWYNYRELADGLIPYLKENGWNYLELMPVSEHPFDGSWGYQSTGFFSPTSRFGTPEDLKYLVDQMHANGIGVLLDFVPVHFAMDQFALANYDGTPLYEYPNNDVGKNEWGSHNFMHSRGEVRSFLKSSAEYWLDEFHFDGLRLDAVSNLIYWQGDSRRGVNGMTIDFLKTFNKGLKDRHPGIIMCAEDSSAYKGVTAPVEEGGLGFDLKWDLGWMNDTLSYFQTPFEYRKDNYHKLTFSMVYFYDEHFILPLSHDEVVHGKGTIVNKMTGGDLDLKRQQARALYAYMMAHPGKKLNFMGHELGTLKEWNEAASLEWELLEKPENQGFARLIRDLNLIYQNHPALYEKDYDKEGYKWLQANDPEHGVYAFIRQAEDEVVLAVFNFSDKDHQNYVIDLSDLEPVKDADLLIDSTWDLYGGETETKPLVEVQETLPAENSELIVNLPASSAKYYILNMAPKKSETEDSEKKQDQSSDTENTESEMKPAEA